MKTVEQRAKKWIDENVVLAEHCDIEYPDLYKKLEILLKEQDQYTRHKCAEAVIQFPDDAQNVCMNVQAV